jgi:hypothetical protein
VRGRPTSITPRRDGLDLSRLSSEVRWSRIADWNASVRVAGCTVHIRSWTVSASSRVLISLRSLETIRSSSFARIAQSTSSKRFSRSALDCLSAHSAKSRSCRWRKASDMPGA